MNDYNLFDRFEQGQSQKGYEIGSVADRPVERHGMIFRENDLFACEAATQAGWRDKPIGNRRERGMWVVEQGGAR